MHIHHHASLLALFAIIAPALADEPRPVAATAPAITAQPSETSPQKRLIDAIMRADVAAMNRALQSGATIAPSDPASKDALDALMRVGSADLYAAAAKAGLVLRDLDTKGWNLLDLQLFRPYARAADVKYLLDQGFKFDQGVWQDGALQSVAAARNPEITRLLLDRGAEVNLAARGDGYVPFTYALAVGTPEVVRLLHSKGATPDEDGIPPFTAALAQPDPKVAVEMMTLLVEFGYKPNEEISGHTPLMLAVRSGSTDATKLLIAAGADVNAVGDGKMTALHYAAGTGSVESISALIAAKANVNARNSGGNTPLHHAIRAADPTSVLRVASNRTEHFDEAVYAGALWRDHVAAIRLLVQAGADVNATDNYGYTPLAYAAVAGDAYWITQDGRDRTRSSSVMHLGRTLCERLDIVAIVKLLVDAGAVRYSGTNAIDPLAAALVRTDHRADAVITLIRTAKVDASPQPKPALEWDQSSQRPGPRRSRPTPAK